ncbi:MAG TPA: putative ABC exporter domain-containing protein [Dehalococcoidia bacterium]|nr:putative ABC exporter domain-containing protein [Dehalococcoidia bacterium]
MLLLILRTRLKIWRRSLGARRGLARYGPAFSAIISLVVGAFTLLGGAGIASATKDQYPGREADLLLLPFLALLLFVLLSGIGTALNELFVASDIELLLTAPLPDLVLFALKLFDTTYPSLLTAAWIACSLAGFGIGTGASPLFYAAALLSCLLLTALLAAFNLGLVLLLARVFPAKRLREAVLLAGSALGVGVWLLWYASSRRGLFSQNSLDKVSALGGWVRWTPPGWAAALAAESYRGRWLQAGVALVALAGCLALLVAVAYALFTRVFLSGWSSAREAGPRRRRSRAAAPARTHSVALSIAIKDWRTTLRDWPYLSTLLPSLAYAIGYPFILVRLPAGHGAAAHWLSLAPLPIVPLLMTPVPALAAVSREGPAFDVLRAAPLEPGGLLLGKTIAVATPVAVLTALAGMALAFLHQAPAGALIVAALGGAWLAAGCSAAGVAVGAFQPRFDQAATRGHQSGLSAGCLLYTGVALLFMTGSVALAAAAILAALSRLGGAGTHVMVAGIGLVLFAIGLSAVLAVAGVALDRLRRLLEPQDV